MSKFLSPTNSQEVLGSLDPLSFPSEPPDIRNWFPSYVYKSPELNTLDGFHVSDVCTETSIGDDVQTKLRENGDVLKCKREDELVAGVGGSLDGSPKDNGSKFVEIEHDKPPAVVLGSLDPLSFPSEPPDIRNWFPSYVYESLELNTLDGFRISDLCRDTSFGDDVQTKLGKNGDVLRRKREDELVGGVEGSLDGSPKGNGSKSFEIEHDKPPAVVAEFSDAFSLCSEPPHIKNWFSCYVYESPLPDTTDNFSIFSYNEREDDSVINPQKTCKENEKDGEHLSDVEQRDTVLPTGNNNPAVVLRCTNFVENVKQENQTICKDGCNNILKPASSTPGQLTSQNVCGQTLPEQKTHNHNHGSVENLGNKDTEVNSWKSRIGVSNEKENEEAKVPDNGFISTRKNGRDTNNRSPRPHLSGVQPEVQRNRIKTVPKSLTEKLTRKVLSETTNFQSINAPEVTGKWRCPQKYKPNLGPPLKQLRAGGTQRLPRLVGRSIAKELIFTGRKIVGREALFFGYTKELLILFGLVNYCVPFGEARAKALEIARDINHKGPLAIRMAKRAIDGGLEVDMISALEVEEQCYEQLLHTKDRLEGLAAFAERRKPNYTGN